MMSEVKIKPLGMRVLVQPLEAETKTASGIIIPDSAQEKQLQAKVVAVSDEVKEVKLNDTVLYAKFTGSEISSDGKNYLMLEVSDILATI